MNEKWMKEMMEDVRMTDGKKDELWKEITRKASYRKTMKRRMAAAAAILALLVIPSGVYAATTFGWKWDAETETKNKALDTNFKTESGSAEMEGFRFTVEKAFCDESLGIAYSYVSVTDESDKKRNPREHDMDAPRSAGVVYFDFNMKRSGGGNCIYDEENSTDTKAYYYVEDELSDKASREEMNQLKVECTKVEKVEYDNDDQGWEAHGILLGEKIITVQNVIAMPSLTWNIEEGAVSEEVRVSSIAARLKESNSSRLEIVLNDGKEIRDYFRYYQSEIAKDGTLPNRGKGAFTSKSEGTEPGTLYRFEYIDIDTISGIRLDGTFYPVSEAKRSDE